MISLIFVQVSSLKWPHIFNLQTVIKDGEWTRDSCHMYDLNYSALDPAHVTHIDNSSAVRKCQAWEFDTSEFNGTIVEKVKMSCLHINFLSNV